LALLNSAHSLVRLFQTFGTQTRGWTMWP
jgi:hypothetical protein